MAGEYTKVEYRPVPGGYEPVEQATGQEQDVQPIQESIYLEKLSEINDSFRILTGKDGIRLETAIANGHAASNQLVLYPSTSLSSLTQNIGNAIELAHRAAANPNTAYLYAAFPGNGHSSSFTPSEQLYRLRSKRLTVGEGEAGFAYHSLSTISRMARILMDNGLVPSHISADESGGRLGLAYMAAFEKNAVRDARLNGIPGVSARASYTKEMAVEDIASRQRRRGEQEGEPGEINDFRKKQAKEKMPRIYSGIDQKLNAVSSIALRGWFYNGIPNLAGFSGKNDLDKPHNHAAIQDTLAALSQQEAMITFQFNQASKLHDREDCIRFGQRIMELLPEALISQSRGVRIIFGEGGLDHHTEVPAARIESERLALDSIARFLVAMPAVKRFFTPTRLKTAA